MERTKGAWQRPFFTMFVGQAFSIFGSYVAQFAITLYLAFRSNSAMVLTLAMLAGYLPQIVLGPIIGALVDRLNRKTTMIFADLFVAAASAALMLSLFWGDPPLYFIYIILMLRSLGQGFHEPASIASVPMIVPQSQLALVGGYRQAVDSLAIIVAPSVAAILLGIVTTAHVMILDIAGAVIASLILLLFVDIPNPAVARPAVQHKNFWRGLKSEILLGVHELTKTKGLVILSFTLTVATFIYIPIATLFVLFVRQNFSGGNTEIAVVQSACGIGMLLGSLLLGQFGRLKRGVMAMCLSIIVMGVMLLAMSLLPPSQYILLVVLSALSGLLFPTLTSPFFAMLQTLIPPNMLGRVTALVKSVITVATPVGLLIGGPISEFFGVGQWFFVSSILVIILGGVCLTLPSIRRLDVLLNECREKSAGLPECAASSKDGAPAGLTETPDYTR